MAQLSQLSPSRNRAAVAGPPATPMSECAGEPVVQGLVRASVGEKTSPTNISLKGTQLAGQDPAPGGTPWMCAEGFGSSPRLRHRP